MSILIGSFLAAAALLGAACRLAFRRKTSGLNYCPVCARKLVKKDIGGRIKIACPTMHWVNWDNPKPVAVVLVPLNGKLVLVRRKFNPAAGSWALPGGYVEPMEHPAEGAVREVFEETGLKVIIVELLDVLFAPSGANEIIFFYLAAPAAGTPVISEETTGVQAFSKDELPAIAFSTHRLMVTRWFDRATRQALTDEDTRYLSLLAELSRNRLALSHAMGAVHAMRKELLAATNLKRADVDTLRSTVRQNLEVAQTAAAALDVTMDSLAPFSQHLEADSRAADLSEARRVRREADQQSSDVLPLLG